MNFKYLYAASIVFCLSACSSLDGLLTFARSPAADPEPTVAVAPQPVPQVAAADAATAQNAWCVAAATADVTRAASDGFDTATQQRMATTTYQQCVAMLGASQGH
jgi:hypothetical protein